MPGFIFTSLLRSRPSLLKLFLRVQAWLSRPGARGAFLSILIQGQFIGLQLLTSILLARLLGPKQYGIYGFALALIMLLQVFAISGLENVMVRFSAAYAAAGDWALLRGLYRAIFFTATMYGVAAAALLVVITQTTFLNGVSAFSSHAVLAAAVPILLLPIMGTLGAAVRGIHPGVLGQLPQYLIRPIAFLAILAILAFGGHTGILSPTLAMLSQAIAASIALLFAVFSFTTKAPTPIHTAPHAYDLGRWFKAALPLALMGGLYVVNTQTDILMLGTLSSARETGIYKVASQGGNLVAVALAATNIFISPRVAILFSEQNLPFLQRILTTTTQGMFIAATAIAAVLCITGSWLLTHLFGYQYVAAYPALVILVAGQLVNVAMGSVDVVLNMTGHERETLFVTAIAAALNITLNLLLIPAFGSVGAATATAITMASWNIAMVYRLWRTTGLLTTVLVFRGRN